MAPKAIEVLLGVIHISFWLALLVPGAGASLIPVGRALASIDPSAAADFFVRVLPGSFRVEQNFSSTSPECDVEIAAVRLPYGAQPDGAGQLIYFVRDGVAPWGDAPLEPYVSQQVADFDAQANGSLVYDRWEDQHDGYHFETYFDVFAIARRERFTLEKQNSTTLPWPWAALDVLIPSTVFNFQLWGNFNASRSVMEPFARAAWENCRNESDGEMSRKTYGLFWWKATQATTDVEAAAAFVARYFGATRVASPFSQGADCTEAAWLLFEDSGFMLHFVNSPEYPSPNEQTLGLATWETATGETRLRRDLARGALDGWTWNRVIFWVDDIRTIEAKLVADGVAFAKRAFKQNGLVSLLVASPPQGSIVYELRALDPGAADAAEPWDVCNPLQQRRRA